MINKRTEKGDLPKAWRREMKSWSRMGDKGTPLTGRGGGGGKYKLA